MPLSTLLASLFLFATPSALSRPAARRKPRALRRTFKPCLEGLEDRLVPSSLDSLYIGDGANNTVKKFDAATGAYEGMLVTSGSAGLAGPRGMILGDGHDLLVNDQRNAFVNVPSDVLRYDSENGSPLTPVVATTNAHAPLDPRGIVRGPNDSVFVADLGDLGNIYRTGRPGRVSQFDEQTGAWIRDLSPPVPFTTNNGPRGVVIGPDGDLYVTVRNFNPLGGEIMRFDPVTGTFLGDFVDSNATNDLQRPEGLAFGPDGNLYVTSFRTNSFDTDKILEFSDTTGAYVGKIDLDQVGQPRAYAQALLFGPGGKLFVPITNTFPDNNSPYTGEVRRYDVRAGTFDVFVPPQASGGPLGQPWYLTFGNTDPSTLDYETPSLTVDATSLDLGTATYGTAGTTATYTLSGNALAGNVLITAPAGVEISTDGTN